jgi:hypothetical protein
LNRRLWIKVLAFIAALYVCFTGTRLLNNHAQAPSNNGQAIQLDRQITIAANNAANDSAISNDTQEFTDHSEVTGNGTVIKILADDIKAGGDNGSRHQRFILRLPSGQTVLVVHNIDVAPRIELLTEGDTIVFKGVYIRNSQGGLIHWTHRDPDEKHEDGWLKRNGRIYQ